MSLSLRPTDRIVSFVTEKFVDAPGGSSIELMMKIGNNAQKRLNYCARYGALKMLQDLLVSSKLVDDNGIVESNRARFQELVNDPDKSGLNCIHYAVINGQLPFLTIMIRHFSDIIDFGRKSQTTADENQVPKGKLFGITIYFSKLKFRFCIAICYQRIHSIRYGI